MVAIVRQADANFKKMGLKTQVKFFRGNELNISKLDKTDAVAVIGAQKDVVNTIKKMDKQFGGSINSFGGDQNPEASQAPGKIIAIDA